MATEGPERPVQSSNHSTDISAHYPLSPPPSTPSTFSTLKERIRHHYELASSYYYSLWGEHIHHGYFDPPTLTKEDAQRNLITLLLRLSALPKHTSVLDVGCGIGGTSRYLAKEHGCHVLGITISGTQVSMATRLSVEAGGTLDTNKNVIKLGEGSVRFLELDAETMGEYFTTGSLAESFDAVWISEALSHLPGKKLFFENAARLLNPDGTLVVADWFKAKDLQEAQIEADIRPIEDGMLLPPLCTQLDYVTLAKSVGFENIAEPMDISEKVKQTW
ncbi:MAG: hypothetical protein Q9227_002281 [Pyrenula ochraceoflavens]